MRFEVAFTLGGAIGGVSIPKDAGVVPERVWFSTRKELMAYIIGKTNQLCDILELEKDCEIFFVNRRLD